MKFEIPNTPEELFRQGGQNLSQISRQAPYVLLVIGILSICLTSFYSVDQDEVGVIRRFGKYMRTTSPGLHWKLPLNIESLDKVKVTRVFKEEFGFRTLSAGVNTKYSTKGYEDESLMLTGDLNVIDVTWIVQFRVKDPVQLLFNLRNPLETIRDISESIMRQVIGDTSVTEALTTRKNDISLEVHRRMQDILDYYEIGIQVDKVELQDVNPPQQVKSSFNDVNEAEQEREQVINQSWEAYNKVIPKAKGEAEKTIREAEGYALARTAKAQGDANKFTDIWKAYREAKDVTRKRLYLETMEEILPKVDKVYVFDPQAKSVIPFLNLNQGQKTQ